MQHAVEEVVGLREAGAKDHHVGLKLRAVLQAHARRGELLRRALDDLDLAALDHVTEVVVQDLTTGEDIHLYGGARHHLFGEAELHAEHQLHDAPPHPLHGREQGMEIPLGARDVPVRRAHEMAEARIRPPLEGHQVAEVAGHRPMCGAKQQGAGLAHVPCRDGGIDCGFAASHDDDVLPCGDIAVLERLRMQNLALEVLSLWHFRDVRRPTIHPRRHHDEVELLLRRLRSSLPAMAEFPAWAGSGASGKDLLHPGVEADQLEQIEALGIALDVLLRLGARWEVAILHVAGPRVLRELVELPRHLQAKVRIVGLPHTSDVVRLLKDHALLSDLGQGPSSLQARDATADDRHTLDVSEVLIILRHEAGYQALLHTADPPGGGRRVEQLDDAVDELVTLKNAIPFLVHLLEGTTLEGGVFEGR
mmetsp:Transcript_47853/g.152899  ORF Transcript_47853/g.152899 Transcript_47853/m.152899 type:complete len:421 (-) Transcript_47853:345-1607(-)